MKHIVVGALFVLGSLLAGKGSAATLGLTTGDPTVTASGATVDYLEFVGGNLSTFAAIDTTSGISLGAFPQLSFGVGFDLLDPTTGLSGGFGINDVSGQVLTGDLIAVGFTDSVIELQFGNLMGSAVGDFGASVLATVSFSDALGPNPFSSLVNFTRYGASITIANVQSDPISPIPLPAGIWLLLAGIFSLGWARRAS